MASPHVTLPVILLISANENIVSAGHLRNLREEIRRIRDALKPAELKGLCTVLYEANATADRFFDYFTDERYRNRIAIFHFAGHANEDLLMLESAAGGLVRFHAEGLAQFLGEQRGLQLVFLNGCSTDAQVDGLLRANCSAVIGTSRSIDDEVAMAFAAAFYREVGAGSGLASAFNAAVGATRAQRGEVPRAMYHGGEPGGSTQADRWPWALQIKPGAEEAVRRWNLPDAAEDPLFGLPPLPPDIDLPESPFRSLSWFEREHAGVFFGRAFQIREICNRITAADAAPILLVYGESGVGKSSLLAAGVLPRLESSHRVEYLRRDPALGLLGTLMQCLDAGADVLEMQAAWRRAETGKPLLVVLDQAEEAFTRPMAAPQQELTDFFDALQALFGTAGARPRGRLILGFRKEWLPEFEARLAERRLPKEHQFLQTLDRRGIVAAIEGPTRREKLHATYGLTVDEGLAAEIADDLLADPESPVAPTLQILLTKLWHEARQQDDAQPRFTRALYLQLKRSGILLQDFLDQQLAEVERWRPEIIQSGLALDLLAFHTTAKGTAQQRTAEELLEAYAHAGGDLPEIIRRFGYLMADIPSQRRGAPRGTRLAHDTLAPLVREHFEGSDRPGQRARRILENRAIDWKGEREGPLLDDDDLRIVEAGATGMRQWTDSEKRLVSRSREARERMRLEAERAARELSETQQSAELQRQAAERQARKAFSRLLASEAAAIKDSSPIRALLLAAEAVKRPFEADGITLGRPESLLRELVARVGGTPLIDSNSHAAPTFDPRGRWLATGGSDGVARLWDLRDPEADPRELRGHEDMIRAIAFDAEGRWLVTSSHNETIRIWDLECPKAASRILLVWPETLFLQIVESHDYWIAAVGAEGIAYVWNLRSPESEPRILGRHEGEVWVLAFDSQGRWLATGGQDGTARVWDLHAPEAAPYLLPGHDGGVTELAFDRSGRWLAARGSNRTVRLWDIQSPRTRARVLGGHALGVSRLVFDHLGRWLATAGAPDRTACLWDLHGPMSEPHVLNGHTDDIEVLAFDPQGRWLATGSKDGTARLWDLLSPGTEPYTLRGHGWGVPSITFDARGRWCATGSGDGTVRLLDLQSPRDEPCVLHGDQSSIRALVFDGEGRWLAAQSVTVRLWDLMGIQAAWCVANDVHGHWLAKGGRHGRIHDPSADRIDYLFQDQRARPHFAIDTHGRWLARWSHDSKVVHLWELQRPGVEPRKVLSGCGPRILALVFDVTGRWLAIGSDDSTARLWDLRSPKTEPRILTGHDGWVFNLAFDHKGRWLATGDDRTVRLWDLQCPEVDPRVLTGHEDLISTLAIDSRGRWLASGSDDTTVRIWDLRAIDREPIVLRGHEGRIVALAFDHRGRRLSTAAEDATARVWNLQTANAEACVVLEPRTCSKLAFGPKGRWLLGSSDASVRLWDLKRPKAKPRTLLGHGERISALAFDDRGRWVATGSDDGTARLWDLLCQEAEPRVLRGHEGSIKSMAFDPQCQWLATGSDDGTARLWPLGTSELLDLACRKAGRNLTLAEWQQHAGDEPYRLTYERFPSGA